MRNTFGNHISVTLFGESHGEAIGALLDGMAPGVPVDEEYIAKKLAFRRPVGAISTSRVEPDRFSIVSGVYNGKTNGAPLCILIPNENTNSGDYEALKKTPRPGHADYTAFLKYHGFADPRGGGHFSGRLTAPLVALGAIAQSALASKGILIGTHIKSLYGIEDRPFGDLSADIQALEDRRFAVLDEEIGEEMKKAILDAANEGDSVGGVLESAVTGLPAGLGEPWFDSVESMLSHALFSIPGVKGVEFGDGFSMAKKRGSQTNDAFTVIDGKIVTKTNHNGGINGGITNGMPLVFSCAVKPTPSIFKEQETVDLETMTDTTLTLSGRHDPAIVHRARAVVDALTALCLCDLLAGRYGEDRLAPEGKDEE